MSENILEINGRRYDAISGALVSASDDAATVSSPVENSSKPEAASDVKPASAPAKPRQPHQVANHLNRHGQEKSKTFNRKSVKKPLAAKKPSIKPSAPLAAGLARTARTTDNTSLIHKSAASVAPSRAEHAHLASRSASIKHFSPATASASANTARTHLPHPKTGQTFDIAPPPKRQPPLAASASTASIASTFDKSDFTKLIEQHEQATNHRYLESPKARDTSRRGLLAKLKPGHKRASAFAATGLAILLIASFVVYENKANIELQLADAKAGINATLPDYKPAGFGVASFRYQPGVVAINYHSSADGHQFQLIQKASGYASKSALADLVAGPGQAKTLSDAGRTIYVNASGTNASAAWLDGGILYLIRGNASLSDQQLLNIASST